MKQNFLELQRKLEAKGYECKNYQTLLAAHDPKNQEIIIHYPNRSQPVFKGFGSPEMLQIRIGEFLGYQIKKEIDKKATTDQLKVGDILCCEWGATMSLVNFFKVLAIDSKKKFQCVELNSTPIPNAEYLTDKGSCRKIPSNSPAKYLDAGETYEGRVTGVNSFKIKGRIDFEYAEIWDGESKYFCDLD